jgi:hypothetical protein
MLSRLQGRHYKCSAHKNTIVNPPKPSSARELDPFMRASFPARKPHPLSFCEPLTRLLCSHWSRYFNRDRRCKCSNVRQAPRSYFGSEYRGNCVGCRFFGGMPVQHRMYTYLLWHDAASKPSLSAIAETAQPFVLLALDVSECVTHTKT